MPGTGNWLLNNKSYRDWKDKPGSIWLHGPPGSGKTVLTTLVINDCLGKLTNASNTLLYFYFDFADSERLTQEAMLRSIIWQLASTDPALRSLASLYKSCSNGQRQPSRQQMHELFAQMADQRSDVFLVIDAIDECTDREQLLWFIRYFTIGPKINLHLCVSSRREKDIEERLQVIAGHNARIGLEKDLVNKDIQHYVRQRLDLDEGLGRWKRMPGIQKEIERTIVRQADGM
jgi:Cdc6-like AAA superfamily ATPase